MNCWSQEHVLTDNHTPITDTSLNNTKDPNRFNGSQVDVHTLVKNLDSKVRTEVDSVMTMVETRVQDAVMIPMEILVFLRVELASKSGNASSGHGVGSVVLDPDQRFFREISMAYNLEFQVELTRTQT